ncbi:MAG TPA: trypsin-like peptidase domain-containing protein [Candidatus Aquicultor sp.]|jgi:S1-C subfamily serine protease
MEERSDRTEKGWVPHEVNPPSKRTGGVSMAFVVAAMLLSAIIGGFVIAYALPYMYGSTPGTVFGAQPVQQTGSSGSTPKAAVDTSGLVTPAMTAARNLMPSVINVGVIANSQSASQSGSARAEGSGVIYTADGYIITSNHVVEGAQAITVNIGADEERARLVAVDPETDIAVIKVNRTGLQAAELGSTTNLAIGAPAVAIGSPFGFQHTVTSGIISGLNRNFTVPADQPGGTSTTYTDLIQTDAPINPGNSGGALSDATGKVIGINTLIISSTGANDGIGFAIPIETAKSVAGQLIQNGKASHPYIGILGGDVNDLAQGEIENNPDIDEGVLIVQVTPGDPAAQAGLKKGDIIIAINGKKVTGMADLVAAMRASKVGGTVDVTFLRNGKKDNVSLTLAENPKG